MPSLLPRSTMKYLSLVLTYVERERESANSTPSFCMEGLITGGYEDDQRLNRPLVESEEEESSACSFHHSNDPKATSSTQIGIPIP